MNAFFIEQMAMYSSYHRDARNRATHFIGIPAIMFSLLVPTSWISIAGPVTLAWVMTAAAILYYLWLERGIGAALGIVIIAMLWAAQSFAAMGTIVGWSVFALTFIGGWIIQLVGHAYEGRRPALSDNALQTLIAPMFIMTEVFVAMGLKREIHDAVESRWQAYSDPKAA